MSEMFTIDTGAALFKPEDITPLPLYDENHPMLRVAIPEYKGGLPSHNMNTLIKRLKLTMKLYGGVGLSANQCGVFERVFVIGHEDFQIACINPKVIGVSADLLKENEGCLSYPGLYLKIERPKTIQVEFTAENGEIKQMELDGLTARCFLHELDHMNGIVYTQRAKPLALQSGLKKRDKIMKSVSKHGKKFQEAYTFR